MAGDEGSGVSVPRRPIQRDSRTAPFFIHHGDVRHGPFSSIKNAAAFAATLAPEPPWTVVRGLDAVEAPPVETVVDEAMAPPETWSAAPVAGYRHLDFRTVSNH
jgi:hypothetical protein